MIPAVLILGFVLGCPSWMGGSKAPGELAKDAAADEVLGCTRDEDCVVSCTVDGDCCGQLCDCTQVYNRTFHDKLLAHLDATCPEPRECPVASCAEPKVRYSATCVDARCTLQTTPR